MNVFVLDEDPFKSAEYLVDKHITKILIEQSQILCSAYYYTGKEVPEGIYRLTHPNHPWCKWVRESLSNWIWLRDYTIIIGDEFFYRYGKSHKSALLAIVIPNPELEDKGLRPFPQVVPERCK